MAKLLAVTIVVIAIASAIPIVALRNRDSFGDPHRDAHVADATGHLHPRPSDR